MKNFLDKIKSYIVTHKVISVIVIIVIIGIGYWGYIKITTPATQNRYVLSAVTTGTIVSSITDSGQVSAFNQITVNPTVSGTLTGVNVKAGDAVRQGETLFNIDNTTAEQAVRDAKIGLQKAELALATTESQNANSDTEIGRASCRERVCQYV